MDTLILAILAKIKFWIAGFITGAIFYYFEFQIGRINFHLGKFLVSCASFGFLTEFSRMVVFGWFLDEGMNPDKTLVLSIGIASFLYLFIPFVLREENRGKFVQSILEKFGFEKKKI